MPNHTAAKNAVHAVLSDPAIGRIRIRLRGVIITPAMLWGIRDMVHSNQIHVRHLPGLGSDAQYDSANDSNTPNSFLLKHSQAGGYMRRAMIVHEAIHAACDHANFGHMHVDTSEAAAYIGQCLFVRIKRPPTVTDRLSHSVPIRDRVFETAWICAEAILAGGQPTQAQIEDVRTAVRNHPWYSSTGDTAAGYNGIDFSGWRAIGL